MKSAILIAILLISSVLRAQFYEDFSDGDFLINPPWTGDTSFFLVNNEFQLQSQGPPSSSEIYLQTEHSMSKSSIWEFKCKLDFSPSGSNHARFYLYSNSKNLSSDLNGYYIKIGGESGSIDGIDLYLQEDDDHSKIIDGISGFVGKDSNEVHVKVIRDHLGYWTLLADSSNSGNLIFQGSTIENTFLPDNNFGILCKHTSTRSDKFFFDDISIRNAAFDFVKVEPANDSLLILNFSNPLDTNSILSMSQFSLRPGMKHPTDYFFDHLNPYQLIVQFDETFEQREYSLEVSGLRDNEQQEIAKDSLIFIFYPPVLPGKLIINEFMHDPSPGVGLPEAEFVELLNISSSGINLAGLKYADTSKEIELPELILDSGEYLILCDVEDTAAFKWLGQTLGLDSWPTLNNSGDEIKILNPEAQIIDQISYNTTWFPVDPKSEGGWSLERINPFKKCSDAENWAYSVEGAGGTPGSLNSVYNDLPDSKGPKLREILVFNRKHLKIEFDEILDFEQNLNSISFLPENSIDQIIFDGRFLELVLSDVLDSGELNQIHIDTIFDCEGNLSTNIQAEFGIGKKPEIFDILITEIMYDPEPQNGLPASEYVEIYNASDFILSLRELIIISEDDTSIISDKALFPEEYLIMIPSSKASEFASYGEYEILSPWISLKNDNDEIRLYNQKMLIHEISYSEDWIRKSDKREGGWSLEMIDPSDPCGEMDNWDASEDISGGTPGRLNSIYAQKPDLRGPEISNVEILNAKKLLVKFDEKVNPAFFDPRNIQIASGPEIDSLIGKGVFTNQIELFLNSGLDHGIFYDLHIHSIADCILNFSDPQYSFLYPENPSPGDIIINEILFDSPADCSEFVEIFNSSTKTVDLKNTYLKYYSLDKELKSNIPISESTLAMTPYSYLLFCDDSLSIKEHYPKNGNNFIVLNSFPALSNEGAYLVLTDSSMEEIDSAFYTEEYHFDLIDNTKGVSLERLSEKMETLNPDNWTSAAEANGFASPGLPNSHLLKNQIGENRVQIEPDVFSPDGDSYKDILQINVRSDNPNEILTIRIFDERGNPVRFLKNNVTLASENTFLWNGINEGGQMSRMGNYILVFDFFNNGGKSQRIKKVVSLAGRI